METLCLCRQVSHEVNDASYVVEGTPVCVQAECLRKAGISITRHSAQLELALEECSATKAA